MLHGLVETGVGRVGLRAWAQSVGGPLFGPGCAAWRSWRTVTASWSSFCWVRGDGRLDPAGVDPDRIQGDRLAEQGRDGLSVADRRRHRRQRRLSWWWSSSRGRLRGGRRGSGRRLGRGGRRPPGGWSSWVVVAATVARARQQCRGAPRRARPSPPRTRGSQPAASRPAPNHIGTELCTASGPLRPGGLAVRPPGPRPPAWSASPWRRRTGARCAGRRAGRCRRRRSPVACCAS